MALAEKRKYAHSSCDTWRNTSTKYSQLLSGVPSHYHYPLLRGRLYHVVSIKTFVSFVQFNALNFSGISYFSCNARVTWKSDRLMRICEVSRKIASPFVHWSLSMHLPKLKYIGKCMKIVRQFIRVMSNKDVIVHVLQKFQEAKAKASPS